MAGFEGDPHSQKGSDCPKNFLGIVDFPLLTKIERVFVHKRMRELAVSPLQGSFNAAHLQATHRYMFQDVFPWAGEFRLVDISKGSSSFGRWIHIASALQELLAGLRREDLLRGFEPQAFADRAAFYLGEINAIHPFREGNGRTQREFIRQLALAAGHPLSWAGFTQEEMVAASIRSHVQGDHDQLASILERALDAGRDL